MLKDEICAREKDLNKLKDDHSSSTGINKEERRNRLKILGIL